MNVGFFAETDCVEAIIKRGGNGAGLSVFSDDIFFVVVKIVDLADR